MKFQKQIMEAQHRETGLAAERTRGPFGVMEIF